MNVLKNTYSTSVHQGIYQKLIKCFSKNIPFHIISNIINEEDLELVIVELLKIKTLKMRR